MRLVLSGYYGFGNTGDEAILEATMAGLKERLPSAQFTVLSNAPEETIERFGVTAVNRWSLPTQVAQLYRADLFIQGGGGLYQDTTSKLSPMYYFNQLVLSRLLQTPFVIFAQGIGPIQSTFLQGTIVRNFARARLITVRDAQSADVLRAWRLKSPEPIITADPVLTMEPCSDERLDELLAALRLSRGSYTLLALRSWPESEHAYEAICEWLGEINRPVLLLPFQDDRDRPIAESVRDEVGGEHLHIPPAAYEPREIMGLIRAADIVLAMRLHAMIMACAVGTPAAGISYDPKVNAFCHRSGQPVMDIRLVERGATNDLISAARDSFDRVLERREDLIAQARRNFTLVERVCEELGLR
ncbi:MAG: polysaccharide pyruvyl transferase CsaB [Armatimonadota bacterium]